MFMDDFARRGLYATQKHMLIVTPGVLVHAH